MTLFSRSQKGGRVYTKDKRKLVFCPTTKRLKASGRHPFLRLLCSHAFDSLMRREIVASIGSSSFGSQRVAAGTMVLPRRKSLGICVLYRRDPEARATIKPPPQSDGFTRMSIIESIPLLYDSQIQCTSNQVHWIKGGILIVLVSPHTSKK